MLKIAKKFVAHAEPQSVMPVLGNAHGIIKFIYKLYGVVYSCGCTIELNCVYNII